MPPQQGKRLLDLGDNSFGFGTHIRRQASGIGGSGNKKHISGVADQVSMAAIRSKFLLCLIPELPIPDPCN
jgi:hypothetical protein